MEISSVMAGRSQFIGVVLTVAMQQEPYNSNVFTGIGCWKETDGPVGMSVSRGSTGASGL
jgi:hypothetical protein